jgi:hypothetical protein
MEEFLVEHLNQMYQITEVKIREEPQKLELVHLRDKSLKPYILMRKNKMLLTIFTTKIKMLLDKKMDIFTKKE